MSTVTVTSDPGALMSPHDSIPHPAFQNAAVFNSRRVPARGYRTVAGRERDSSGRPGASSVCAGAGG